MWPAGIIVIISKQKCINLYLDDAIRYTKRIREECNIDRNNIERSFRSFTPNGI